MIGRLRRWFLHRWTNDAARTLPRSTLTKIQARITASETQHHGEVRICVEAGLPNSYLLRSDSTPALVRQRALALFGRLRVWDTEHNNGVLIYLCLAERAIELVADRGIDRHVSSEQWADIVRHLSATLRSGSFEAGLSEAVDRIHALQTRLFPAESNQPNPNELPDKLVVL